MKVIDLLNKIANGEEAPKKFKLGYTIYEQTYKNGEYRDKNKKPFINWIWNLNDEVEIIEEDKEIEEINLEWFKQVDMFEPKNVELAIEMIAKQLNILSKAVNELKKEGK